MKPSGSEGARPGWGWKGYALLAISVWLAVEIVKVPIAQRAPPAAAVRVAPKSPEVLSRAAESELREGRRDNAVALANEALLRAPFNVRALRVRGLADAGDAFPPAADQIMTLAGNWSLRDTQAHSWLVQSRLRSGDYLSAFTHADTLARRRPAIYPQVFDLYSTAAVADPRALPAIVRLLEASPPWRRAYIAYLTTRPDGDPLLFSLAVAMQKTDRAFTNEELSLANRNWMNEGRLPLLVFTRRQLQRPAMDAVIQNGDFEEPVDRAIAPFGWTLATAAGLLPEVMRDDADPDNLAVRVGYDGYSGDTALSQIILLEPGRHSLSGRFRRETPTQRANLEWSVACLVDGAVLVKSPLPIGPAGPWQRFAASFDVPATCSIAQLRVIPILADRRTPSAVWFDDIRISS